MTHAYSFKKCHGGSTTDYLLCFKDKIVMPTSLRKQIEQWYHYLLCHHSINRIEARNNWSAFLLGKNERTDNE